MKNHHIIIHFLALERYLVKYLKISSPESRQKIQHFIAAFNWINLLFLFLFEQN